MAVKTFMELKAKMLCEGVSLDPAVEAMFQEQNPSGAKRGGLSSGGKMTLTGSGMVPLQVNAPFYHNRLTDIRLVATSSDRTVSVFDRSQFVCDAQVMSAPPWYGATVRGFPITQILTAHNRQLVGAIYEDCVLFGSGDQCRFCVIKWSLKNRDPRLVMKKDALIIEVLEQISLGDYDGLVLNGGMTLAPGRGMEIMEPVLKEIHRAFPFLPIAVEMTPPEDLSWINRLADTGMKSLMMNLECWDPEIRRRLIPGKDIACPREMYLRAFDYALHVLGAGKVSTCFVVGTEPTASLKNGIAEVIKRGVIPSPLAGRHFEDVANYPFAPSVDWREFLEVLQYTSTLIRLNRIQSTDKGGCVACGMCDMVKDL